MSTNISPLITFSGEKLDYADFRRQLLIRSTTASTTCAEGYGLMGFLLPTQEWIKALSLANHPEPGPFAPLTHPGERPTAGTQFPAWKADLDSYQAQRQDVNKFIILIRAALDDVSLLAIDEVGGCVITTLAQMLATLDKIYGVLSPSDLARNSDKLLVPFQAPATIRTFLMSQRRVHLVAAENNFPIPETTKVRSLVNALSSDPSFNSRISAWQMAIPTAAAQTFNSLAEAIIEHADNKDVSATSGSLNYASQVVVGPSQGFSQDQLITISQLVALAVQAIPSKTSPQQPSNNQYCWTHGFTGHSSAQCKRPAEGHIEKATGRNQQGGSNRGRRPN
jgi:hypothetical protein